MKVCCFYYLLLVLFEVAGGLVREYIFVDILLNWSDAQKYCRQKYVDLATVRSEEENKQMLSMLQEGIDQAWIGLKRAAPRSNVWQWSNKEPVTFLTWLLGQPNNFGLDQDCVSVDLDGWNDWGCLATQTFFCYMNLNLVMEKKTWLEALEYCRSTSYDLVSLSSPTQLLPLETLAAQMKIDSVWTGLHFLDKRWFWLSGNPLGTSVSLPSCPVHGQHCGARNFSTNTWENRDCNERRYFVCY